MSKLAPAIELTSPRFFDLDDDDVLVDEEARIDISLPKPRHIKDSVHDYITIADPMVQAFIDSPQIQRLRYIKQLGTAYFVWPGASHNRFEHSLGVCHLAGLLVERLRTEQPYLGIDDRDVRCVQLAGLCHDLGHGPFSHVWDGLFMPEATGEPWAHEAGSEMMLDYLVEDNQIDVPEKDVTFVKALIAGDSERCPYEKKFLFQVVANKLNGIDVDKFDYMQRDSHCLGISCPVDVHRYAIYLEHKRMVAQSHNSIIGSSRVIANTICYSNKDAYNIYELFYSRYSLHKRIYNHKAAVAIEHMIVDALVKADPVLKLVEQTRDPRRYLYLTDSVVQEVEKSIDPALEESREIIRRLRVRDLYKIVDYVILPSNWHDIWKRTGRLTPESIVRQAREEQLDEEERLQPQDLIITWSVLHFGSKEQDPIRSVRFYSWQSPHKAYRARKDWISQVTADQWQEVLVRCIVRDPRHVGPGLIRMPVAPTASSSQAPSPMLLASSGAAVPGLGISAILPPPAFPGTPGPPTREQTPNPFTTVHSKFAIQSPMESPIRRRKRDDMNGDPSASLQSTPLKKARVNGFHGA
ncbi:HD-domain/PDEase-like protein [Dacryopinax primogenitus]|uniref:HD-domain/PDEase-like protein n=1 Tax=Dacryopinax primogenitus (strain DJM 731) TaxID=1858805 RepID=M5FSV9_DACPD|nr:HD-domain/PDEase-like protein [Dacryopinax primogenitus]EJT99043.1 HD-domain/PDEase-like protein [Dacryopinax primogenitus]